MFLNLPVTARTFSSKEWEIKRLFFLPQSPLTSYEHQFFDVMSGFTRLIMKTKYVCHGPHVRPHVNFRGNRSVGTVILLAKNCKWGGGEGKRANETNVLPRAKKSKK